MPFLPKGISMAKVSMEIEIDNIYDSIGTCKECLYGSADREKTVLCCNKDSVIFGEINDNDWFCADFERKQDV